MSKKHNPRRGSYGYSPRKRSRSETPRIKSWPAGGENPAMQGFAGYKVGMTHMELIDYRPTSTTSGQAVFEAVTVLETPPMKIAAVRLYKNTPYGLKTQTEIWADNVDELAKRIPLPKKREEREPDGFEEVRVLAYTEPWKITGIPKKVPDLMEIRIGGGDVQHRFEYAKNILGKEIGIRDVFKEGEMIDTIAVTKGKGFQGHVKRWGVKLLHHKNSKHRRMVGTIGPWLSWTRPTVPQAGQTGYHKRTEHNKRILKIDEDGEAITPAGGFPHYGIVRNEYVVLHGSVPGTVKRMVRMRPAIRYWKGVKVEKPEINYISTTSKQGV